MLKTLVMPMYNLIEYSDNCSKTSESSWQHCQDEPALSNKIFDFNGASNNNSFNFQVQITGQTVTNNVEIALSWKYLHNFWRTIEIPLFNFKTNLILTWSVNCVIVSTTNENQAAAFLLTDKNL